MSENRYQLILTNFLHGGWSARFEYLGNIVCGTDVITMGRAIQSLLSLLIVKEPPDKIPALLGLLALAPITYREVAEGAPGHHPDKRYL